MWRTAEADLLDMFECLFKTSMPTVPFWNSKRPVSTRSAFLRATVRSTSSALCLHSCPSLHCNYRKICVSCREAKRLVKQLWSPRLYINTVIVLPVVLSDCCKPTNTCRDWAFSNSGLEAGLPAFQLPCWQNVTHCRKEICWICLSSRNLFPPFRLGFPSIHSLPEAGSWEQQ